MHVFLIHFYLPDCSKMLKSNGKNKGFVFSFELTWAKAKRDIADTDTDQDSSELSTVAFSAERTASTTTQTKVVKTKGKLHRFLYRLTYIRLSRNTQHHHLIEFRKVAESLEHAEARLRDARKKLATSQKHMLGYGYRKELIHLCNLMLYLVVEYNKIKKKDEDPKQTDFENFIWDQHDAYTKSLPSSSNDNDHDVKFAESE